MKATKVTSSSDVFSMTRDYSMTSMLKLHIASSRRLSAVSRIMDSDWPQAPELRYKFMEYAGLTILQGDLPLVFRAMDFGFSEYEKTLGLKPDNSRIEAFIKGTAKYLAEHLSTYKIYNGAELIWNPVDGKSLAQTLDYRHKDISIKITRIASDKDTISQTYQQIISYVSSLQPERLREDLCRRSR